MFDDQQEMLKPGDVFGDYVIERRLGKGGMGVVYLAVAPDGTKLAIKLMYRDKMTHDLRKRFAREAEFAMKIRHKNLITVYDVGEDPETGLCYMVMDYVSGGTLAEKLREQGKLPVTKAVNIVMRIATALEVAHRNGMVHRDIKPENIMFTEDGTPKLADLGVAKFDDDRKSVVTVTGMIIGTPAYMSPEQLMDSHRIDGRADIYSLGVVLYEMLAGTRPNKGCTAVELLAKAIKGEKLPDVRTMSPEVSASVAYVISLMCSPDPKKRPSTSLAAAKLLHKAATGSLVLAKKPPSHKAVQQVSEKAQRKRMLLVSSIVAGFLLATAAGLIGIWHVVTGYFEKDVQVQRQTEGKAGSPGRGVVRNEKIERPHIQDVVITNVVESIVVVTNVIGGRSDMTAVVEKPSPSAIGNTKLIRAENKRKDNNPLISDRRVRYAKVGSHTWCYTLKDGEAIIWRGLHGYNSDTRSAFTPSTATHIKVPSELDGYRVAELGCLAFFRCENLRSIEIPEGVRILRGWSIMDCGSLEHISIPATLRTAFPRAINSCRRLKCIDFNRSSEIEGAVALCTAMEKITVSPQNDSYVAVDGVLYSKDLKTLVFYPRVRDTVTILDSVKRIGRGAFESVTLLTDVKLPDGIEEVDDIAFSQCKGLRSMTFGKNLRKTGNHIFTFCPNLESVTYPSALKEYGAGSYTGCRKLRRVEFLGDAPMLDLSNSLLFGNRAPKFEIYVRKGTKGWEDPATGKLPNCWPMDGFDDARPIRYLDDEGSDKRKLCREDVQGVSDWKTGPSSLWFVDWDKAHAEAKRTRKKLFVLNTGSDWCGWCVKLRNNVLDTSEFKEFAKKNLVLLYLDNPRHTPMSKEQRMHNKTICRTLGFSGGVPHAGVFTANGKKLGTVGGGGLSVDEYVKRLKNILKSRGNEVKGDDAEILFKGQCRRLLKEVAERRAKLPKAAKEDFKAVVTGVAVVDNRERHRYSDMKFFSPETHLTVPFGKTAVFRVEYDFPEGYAARIWTRDEWPAEQLRNSSYFGSNPSGFYRGKGVAYGFLSLLDRGESCELRSLKVITRSDPELEEAENGWIIGTTPVNLDFKDKNDGSNESVDCPQKYVSKDRLHALYRSKDGKHVFVEVCHDSDNRNFSSVRFSLDRVREAISKKVDILFLPLVLSKDGVLFSADRGELENVSNGKGLAGDYTAAQLKRMRIKHRGVLSAKHFKPFEDILRLGKGKILFKVVGSLEYQKELAVLLDKLDAWESVIFEVWDANAVKNHYDMRLREKMISGEILVTACGDRAFGVREVLPECAVSLQGLEKAEATERTGIKGNVFSTFIYSGEFDDQGAWDKALESGVTVFRSNRAADLVKYLKKKGRRSR